ncbi:hypothetical protein [Halocatena salina]|uniref:Uncharacterized protein n=1 Tax=Halocatena salina TaxID=2934340 RepID=A0A8U0A680_9EURY|nr:hypothetical protein [Halocatena salina]UPM44018.1 hypothetical protein MW046_06135 [Halocatena salina]
MQLYTAARNHSHRASRCQLHDAELGAVASGSTTPVFRADPQIRLGATPRTRFRPLLTAIQALPFDLVADSGDVLTTY